MPQEDKSIRSNSRPGKPAGSSPAPTQVPSTNSGQVASTSPEQDLHENEERLRAIVNQVVVGIVQTDLAGRITFTNDRYCEITGYPREELLGKRWQDLTHPDDLPHNIEHFERIVREGNPFTFEKRYKRKNGETVYVDIGSSLLCNAGGQVFGGVAIVVDITKRKQALEALRASEEKFRLLFENSRDALMTVAPPSWKFTSANRSTLKMFGSASETEFTRVSPWNISPEQQPDGLSSAEKARQMIETALRKGSNLFEWTHKRLDGRTFPAEVLLTRMEQDGQVFVQATVRDITERKRLEKEILERRDEMAELQTLQIAAQTASAIAHELNQPLMAIASYNETALILLKAENPNLDKVRKTIEGSERQAHRAGDSIRELLEFLSMKEFSTEAFDLNKEILDVLDTARSEHELQFHSILRLEEGLPLVRASRSHVHKVLFNLLHNGIEAMQEAGVPLPSITVSVRTKKDVGFAQVTIQDNGPGVKKEDFQRLFEPFFSTKARGIGMGLAISRSLIEANGGQLWVDPQESPGATFHFTLPFAT